MIHFEHLTYHYPHQAQPALRDIHLDIPEGSFVGVVGANGAGKSTLCAALAGFVPHHFGGHMLGRVRIDGLDTHLVSQSELALQVGFVFQNPQNQLSGVKFRVSDEVAFGLENLGVPRPEMMGRVAAALARVGIEDLAERSPFELSGGEMQRVALACILVMEPRVLVLDEPTAQLDPVGTRQVLGAVRELSSVHGMTIIMAEQKTEWIAELADRVLVMHEGTVVMDGTPQEVLTADRLIDWGVRPVCLTTAARAAREAGLWPPDRALPITFEGALDGFRRILGADGHLA